MRSVGGEQPQGADPASRRRLGGVRGGRRRDPLPVGRARRPDPAAGEVVGQVVVAPVRGTGEEDLVALARRPVAATGERQLPAAPAQEVVVRQHRVEHVHPVAAVGGNGVERHPRPSGEPREEQHPSPVRRPPGDLRWRLRPGRHAVDGRRRAVDDVDDHDPIAAEVRLERSPVRAEHHVRRRRTRPSPGPAGRRPDLRPPRHRARSRRPARRRWATTATC